MIESLIKASPFIAGIVAGIVVYLKGYADRKRDEKADAADTLTKYNEIESRKVKRDDIYKRDNW